MASPDSALPLILEGLEIPESAYDKAESRYDDLGRFLCREGSRVEHLDPYVFPQGSFLLGTVIRPLGEDEEYDLDLGCSLRIGVSKSTHSQKQLKELIGLELEDYRKERQILGELDPKRRCWRLAYQDKLAFHMDVVPCIPERGGEVGLIKEAMIGRGTEETLANEVADRAVSITDTELPSYPAISQLWLLSNPQGYGRWFQSRVELAKPVRDQILMEKRAEVDPVPNNRRKAPLQRVVQLLKRHRDMMFAEDPDPKPISVIITTLAARAYNGEGTVEVALANVLATMGDHVVPAGKQTADGRPVPRVANPVNPAEDFADKWPTKQGLELDLEGNFWKWLEEAQRDFRVLSDSRDAEGIEKRARRALGLSLDRRLLLEQLGASVAAPAVHVAPQRIVDPPPQWRGR
jgi:hypothetical protein